MNRMKRLICALAVIGVFVMQSNPAFAKFAGTLQSDVPWRLEISPELNNVMFAATITFVDSRGRQDMDIFTTQPGETLAPDNGDIPRGTRRIIIELDFGSGAAAAVVRVSQGTSIISVDASNETSQIVFDVA